MNTTFYPFEFLTCSSIHCLHTCPRHYQLKHRHKLRPNSYSSPTVVAGAVRRGIASYNGEDLVTAQRMTASEVQTMVYRSRQLGAVVDEERELAMSHVLLVGWAKHLDAPKKVQQKDKVFTTAIRHKRVLRRWRYAGRIDATCSSGAIHSYHMTGLPLDTAEQMQRHSLQHRANQFLLGSKAGVTVDLIRKPTIRLRKDESWHSWSDRALEAYNSQPGRFFRRIEIPYEKSRVVESQQYMVRAARLIQHCERYGFPRHYGAGCKNAYGWCDFRGVCWWNKTDQYHRSHYAHDELKMK